MKFAIFYTLLLLATSCSVEKEDSTILEVIAPQTAEQGEPVTIDLRVHAGSTTEEVSLSCILIEGKAQIMLGGISVPTTGEWISAAGVPAQMIVTPTAAGMLTFSLQARSSDGSLSAKQLVSIEISGARAITVEALCKTKVVNPEPGARIPISLHIDRPEYTGEYTVSVSLLKGQGKFYLGSQLITTGDFQIGANGVIDYLPEVLGDHAFEFVVIAGNVSATTHAYIEVVKQLTVNCAVEECFTIVGPGEYRTEAEQVTLKIADEGYQGVNAREYGFEVEGWYDIQGKLLSSNPAYTLSLFIDGHSTIELRLKKRTVTITRNNAFRKEFKYLLPNMSWTSVFDYRTEFVANHRATESIKFYYQEYRYKTVVPPVEEQKMASPTLNKRSLESGFFWRIDNIFTVYLRRADNPDFTFNAAGHYIESESTKYMLPATVIFQ